MNEFDVVVIGGGPAGAAAAITLSTYTALKVAIVERELFDDYRAGESVSAAAFQLLSYLGLTRDKFEDTHLMLHGHSAAWGSADLVVRDFILTPHGNGLLLDRKKFDKLLLETARQKGAVIYQPAKIKDIQKEESWILSLTTGEEDIRLRAKFAIDCSGKNAIIVKSQHCKVHKEDNLIALYYYYDCANEDEFLQHTLLETTEHGWYYHSPLPGNQVAICFITDTDILKSLNLRDQDTWFELGMKTNHIASILSKLAKPIASRLYPIHSRVALLPHNDNWTAAGDAASSFDPISALGIGHALSSGINSARLADSYLKNNYKQIGLNYSRSILEHFENYLRMRHGFYTAEKRWKDAPFWKRRAASPL